MTLMRQDKAGFTNFPADQVAWNEVAVAELALFREKDRQRVFAEIRVLKQLKHRNIMALHDYWLDERRCTLNFITEVGACGPRRVLGRDAVGKAAFIACLWNRFRTTAPDSQGSRVRPRLPY